MEKEKLREIVNTELQINYLQMMYPEIMKDIEDSLVEALHQALNMSGVSKRFEIDFDGNVLAGIEITNNEPKVFGAMNGWGNAINPDKCKITEKTD